MSKVEQPGSTKFERIDSYKTTCAFGVYLFESLKLLPLFDDAHAREEESDNDCHETIDSTEDVVQRLVHMLDDRSHAKTISSNCCGLIRADIATEGNFIRRIEIPTAHQRILDHNLRRITLPSENCMIVVAFMQRVYPDERGNKKDGDTIQQ